MSRERLDSLGDLYLFRDAPGGIIYLGWKEPDPKRPGRHRTGRESLRTRDAEKARLELIERHHETHVLRDYDPTSMLFAELVMTYKAQWLDVRQPRSLDQIRRSLRMAVEEFGDRTVFEVGSPELQEFGEELLGDGKAPGYVQRILNDVRAMYNRATERRWLVSVPRISLEWLPTTGGREIFATPEMARAFWDAIDDPRLRLFTIIAANTGARTERILDLTPDRIDLDHGTIDLRKPNENPRDKKRNAVVKVTLTLRPWLVNLSHGHLVTCKKRWLYELWRETRARAGLGREFVPTIWRHTLTTLLDEQAPEQWVRRWFARASKHQMIDWYTRRRTEHPDYCKPCVEIIDAYMAQCEMRNALAAA